MPTKHDKVTHWQGLSPINSHNPLNMHSGEATLQIKNISPLPQCLWSQDLSEW